MGTIYLYDEYGHLVAEQVALVDETGKIMIPENATDFVPLPAKEGYEVVFNGKTWEYKKNNNEEHLAPLITAKNYIEKRLAEYPDIGEQLDMIYWDRVKGTNNWEEKISEIKAKYPKVDLND